MSRRRTAAILFILILLGLAGCTKSSIPKDSFDTNPENVASGTASSQTPYRVKQIFTVTLDEEDDIITENRAYTTPYGGKLYLFSPVSPIDSAQPSLHMYVFDMDTQKTKKTSFTLNIPAQEGFSVSSVTSAHVTGENEFTFLLYGSFKGKDMTTVLYKCDFTGNALNKKAPLSDDIEPFTDHAAGNHNIYADRAASLLLTKWDEPANTTQIYRYDTNTKKREKLTSLSNEFVSSLSFDNKDMLYYIGNGELKRLDPKTMTCELLCSIQDCGISSYGALPILINSDGELAICTTDGETPMIYLLTNEAESSDVDTIRLVRLQEYGMDYISKLAASWSAASESDGCRIKPEKESDKQKLEALRNRTMAEIVSGVGPELMWVSADDMRMLAEKDALMDISELIPEDIRDNIFPGVIHAGTVDGTMVGITPEISYYTMLAADSVWSKDTWTISEMLDLVESKDDWEWPFNYFDNKPDYYDLFFFIFAQNLNDSPYVDIENGVSHFNGDEFIRVLEFCKKYGPEDSAAMDWDERGQMMKDGKGAVQLCYLYDGLAHFSSFMARCDHSCHIVGYPRSEGSGNYLAGQGYLVVNKKAAHTDAIKDFIAYLLDYDNQHEVSTSPVRRDVIQNSIVKTNSNQTAILKTLSPKSYAIIDTKPDGTTYLEEFIAFADSCEPLPYSPEEISDILHEELPSFFTGNKSAKETADIIHRRVQLYFSENK